MDKKVRERRAEAAVSIAAVERETGLSKDTLRVWERRYGFPTPARDGKGERVYSSAQLERLRLDESFRECWWPSDYRAKLADAMVTARRLLGRRPVYFCRGSPARLSPKLQLLDSPYGPYAVYGEEWQDYAGLRRKCLHDYLLADFDDFNLT